MQRKHYYFTTIYHGRKHDVTMGSYDGAETCELIELYILNKINHIIDNKDVGLYRDGGLAVLRNHSLTEANRKAKEITQIFH